MVMDLVLSWMVPRETHAPPPPVLAFKATLETTTHRFVFMMKIPLVLEWSKVNMSV